MTSLTPSTSLNLFADFSRVKPAAADALGVDVPLHAAWPDELKRRGLACFLPSVLAAAAAAAGDAGAAGGTAAPAPAPAPFVRQLLASRFAPLAAAATATSGPASAAAPPAPPRKKRRRVPPPPAWAQLEPALLDAAADCVQALDTLRHEARAERASRPSGADWAALAPASSPRGVLELTAAHMAELCVQRLFGAERVAHELEALALHCEGGESIRK